MHAHRQRQLAVHITRFLSLVGLLASLVVIVEAPLQAYLDPGGGLMFWQSVMAGVLGAAYFLRSLMRRMKSMMRPGQSSGHGKNEPTSHA